MIARRERTPQHAGPYTRDPAGVWADIPTFTAFAQEVAESMEYGQLRHEQRERLLRRAGELGVRRFDANLIMAMVQNRAGISTRALYDSPKTPSRWPVLATFLIVQTLIIAAGWWLLA